MGGLRERRSEGEEGKKKGWEVAKLEEGRKGGRLDREGGDRRGRGGLRGRGLERRG